MIGVGIALAAIATMICVATVYEMRVNDLKTGLRERQERIEALEDRLQAASLAEYRAVRPVVMPATTPTPEEVWFSDPTGLVRERAPSSVA